MHRHIYNWNIFSCEISFKQQISLSRYGVIKLRFLFSVTKVVILNSIRLVYQIYLLEYRGADKYVKCETVEK